jgi:hypothetical protein
MNARMTRNPPIACICRLTPTGDFENCSNLNASSTIRLGELERQVTELQTEVIRLESRLLT